VQRRSRSLNPHRIHHRTMSKRLASNVMSSDCAIKIYEEKLKILRSFYFKVDDLTKQDENPIRGMSCRAACKFQVSPKTIRDIWSRRTWQQETSHLWTSFEDTVFSKCKAGLAFHQRTVRVMQQIFVCEISQFFF
jgi:hypothetical protein